MKKILLLAISLVLLASVAWSASIPLKATWTPNTEADMAGYNLYRTDGTRLKLNPTLITHPPTLPYNFIVTVPDNSSGTMTFVLTAVDAMGNESVDSVVVNKVYDLIPPVRPIGLVINY